LVIANMRNNNATYTIPPVLAGAGWKNAFSNATVALNGQLYLQPYQHMVLTK
jgi:hypothetical protein